MSCVCDVLLTELGFAILNVMMMMMMLISFEGEVTFFTSEEGKV